MWNWILVKAAWLFKKELSTHKRSQNGILRQKSHTQGHDAPAEPCMNTG